MSNGGNEADNLRTKIERHGNSQVSLRVCLGGNQIRIAAGLLVLCSILRWVLLELMIPMFPSTRLWPLVG